MEEKLSVAELAARSLDDADYAQKVFYGEIDDPQVRDAILSDLYGSTTIQPGVSEKEAKAAYNDKFVDRPPIAGPMGPCFVKYYPKGPKIEIWDEWVVIAKPALTRLAGRD